MAVLADCSVVRSVVAGGSNRAAVASETCLPVLRANAVRVAVVSETCLAQHWAGSVVACRAAPRVAAVASLIFSVPRSVVSKVVLLRVVVLAVYSTRSVAVNSKVVAVVALEIC